jgi:sensor domain CHASE-containing protein
MTWLLAAISICAVNVVAGRAYSRHLDRLEAKAKADPAQVYLNVSPLTVEQLKAGFDCAKQERTTSSASRSRAA